MPLHQDIQSAFTPQPAPAVGHGRKSISAPGNLGELGQVHLCCSNLQFPHVQRKKTCPVCSHGWGKHKCDNGHEKPGQRKEVLRLPMSTSDVTVLPGVGGPEGGEGAIPVSTELGDGRREQHTETERRGYRSSSWLQIKDKIGRGSRASTFEKLLPWAGVSSVPLWSQDSRPLCHWDTLLDFSEPQLPCL